MGGEDKGVFFSGVDTKRTLLWGMVDVYGNSKAIQICDPRAALNNICSESKQHKLADIQPQKNGSCENISKLSEEKQVINPSKPLPSSTQPHRHTGHRAVSPSEGRLCPVPLPSCLVCCENSVDCVLYSCGHMALCLQCAVQVWARDGHCPLCRDSI